MVIQGLCNSKCMTIGHIGNKKSCISFKEVENSISNLSLSKSLARKVRKAWKFYNTTAWTELKVHGTGINEFVVLA